jgi:hypothetical protein
MRRGIGVAVAVLLLGAVAATVIAASSSGKSASAHLVLVRGVIGSEKQPFFSDKAVVAELAKKGFKVQVDTAGSRQIATTVDLSKYDFAFPAGTPAAIKIRGDHHAAATYVPFFTPMAVGTFSPIAKLLEAAGVAQDHGGWWTLDMKGLLGLTAKNTRWSDLPNNTAYPTSKSILVTTTDPRTSNSAAMFAAVASYVANGDNVVANPSGVGAVSGAVEPLFTRQGYTETSSEEPFNDYLAIGAGKTPLVWIYEAQFVSKAALKDGSIQPNMVLMYPVPDVLSKHTLVPLTPNGDQIGQLLTNDPVLQHLAVVYGFRIQDPRAFADFVSGAGVNVPTQLADLIEPPTYETLEAIINDVAAALGTLTTTTTTK